MGSLLVFSMYISVHEYSTVNSSPNLNYILLPKNRKISISMLEYLNAGQQLRTYKLPDFISLHCALHIPKI